MKISNNFATEEFFHSSVARNEGFNNYPSKDEEEKIVQNITSLVSNVLQPLRNKMGIPIHVTSGYRCKDLNDALDGVDNSQHLYGLAADITCVELRRCFETLCQEIEFDQLIYYIKRGFIHVSYVSIKANRKQIIIKR